MLTLQHGKPVLILSNVYSPVIGLISVKRVRNGISCNMTVTVQSVLKVNTPWKAGTRSAVVTKAHYLF